MNFGPFSTRVPAWRRFLAREELARHAFGALPPSRPTVDIMHGDLECRFTFPAPDGESPSFLNYPWLRANRETRPAAHAVLTTDLGEDDAVLGAARKAAACARAAARAAAPGAVVLFNGSCLPELTGEDLPGAAARAARGARAPLIYQGASGQQIAPAFAGSLARALPGSPPKRRSGIALFGHPGGRAQEELVELLSRAGVRTAACVIPDLSPRALAAARAARVLLAPPNRCLERVRRELESALGAKATPVPAPYGPAGTRRWLSAAAAAAGGALRPSVWSGLMREFLPKWERLRAEAAGFRLGLVLDTPELAALSDPAANAGVPLAPLIKEMGFGMDLLVYAGRGLCLPRANGRHRIHPFRTPAELSRRMRALDCRAFYSDFHYDRRITRAGKTQFSLADFEPGLRGALRALERLLEACRLPFYRRYASHLGGAR